ncbi:MAG: PKD-like domain-containing protein [Phocaeicola sp.]|uniref:PKD-like domain-containing protein n=1 Tax=Phocaeicola sp. TaxID=2773926 RepID=UPI003FA0FF87
MKKLLSIYTLLFLLLAFTACSSDRDEPSPIQNKPEISLASGAKFTSKVGKNFTYTPTVKNASGATYIWTMNNEVIGNTQTLCHIFEEKGSYYIRLKVTNDAGSDEEEILVTVTALTPPVISLNIPDGGFNALAYTDYTFKPTFQHKEADGFTCSWSLNGNVVSNDSIYTFNQSDKGSYTIKITASNEDGENHLEFKVNVIESLLYSVTFDKLSYFCETTDRNTFIGHPVYITPTIRNFSKPTIKWVINGDTIVGANSQTLKFTPDKAGDYLIKVCVYEPSKISSSVSGIIETGNITFTNEIMIHAYNNESSAQRAINGSSSKKQNKVYEYVPAPGQFIGDTALAGFTGNETTKNAANSYALERLNKTSYVSLGGFGGYIIVGFDHSIAASANDYDFTIQGNAYASPNMGSDGNSEPGIVWVMQDVNGNGLPDDEWYELKSSETGNKSTIQNYAVTYYKPSSPNANVKWKDSEGNSGTIDYNIYHRQNSYYPTWISTTSYTLKGTRLKARNYVKDNLYINPAYGWGYADNLGKDAISSSDDGSNQVNGFKISNAILPDGTVVTLKYIDFIKVQTGLNTKSGPLGEVSTEVFSFTDYSME